MSTPSIILKKRLVEDLLSESNRAASAGALNAALLLAWGAAETAIRSMTEDEELSGPLLLSFAFNRGLIDSSEYGFALHAFHVRKDVEHGARQANLDNVSSLVGFVESLIRREPTHPLLSTPEPVREIIGGETYDYFPLGEYVVHAPGVCGGRPTFKYTRIEVEGTLQRLAAGERFGDVVAGYGGRISGKALQEAIDIRARPLLSASLELASM